MTQRLSRIEANKRFVVPGGGANRQALRVRPAFARAAAAPAVEQKKLRWPVPLFLFGLLIPWAIYIGTLRTSVYRLLLLLMVLPCLYMWWAGRAGRIRAVDIALVLFTAWGTLSLVVNHGVSESLEPVGIGFIETLGPYFLARRYIRDADDFHRLIQLLFRIVLVLFPFAAIEFVTGDNVWRDFFASFWPVQVYDQMPPRWGFARVQMGFDHPILFGVCIGSLVAPVFLVLGYQKSLFQRSLKAAIVGTLSFMSLSAGPLIGVVIQAGLLCWNGLLRTVKNRWKILIALSVSMGLLIELVANRSLVNILVSFFVFDSGSYWYRLYIWDYASASVVAHPVFGIGLHDWERPAWMVSNSIDNFWLLWAVRAGLPGALLLLVTIMSLFLALAFRKDLDERTEVARTAFLISMVAFFLAGWTVHYWDAAYVFLLFFLGSGVWMLDAPAKQPSDPTNAAASPAVPASRPPP